MYYLQNYKFKFFVQTVVTKVYLITQVISNCNVKFKNVINKEIKSWIAANIRYFQSLRHIFISRATSKSIKIKNTGYTQKNGAVSKVNKKFISHLTRAKRTPSAAATVQVSHALPVVRFSCLLRGHGDSFQEGVTAGKDFLCAPF